MSLHIHRSERADALAAGLAELLSQPLDDPFAPEVVAVPTRGAERWLAQTLATRLGAGPGRADGVCAGIEFPSPRRLLSVTLAGVLDVDRQDDPWAPGRLTWPVLAQLEAARGEQWAALVWAFIDGRPNDDESGGMRRPGRRWSTAAHLAELYDRYGAQRPAMLRAWLDGRDVDSSGGPLDPSWAWQAELWRRVRTAVDRPSPVERLPRACEQLAARPESIDLPQRFSVFGATRIEPDQLQVLDALATHRDVHLWLTHPSPVLWARIAESLRGRTVPRGPRRDDRTSTLPRHRLLAYLGRDVRELQVQLAGGPPPAQDVALPGLPDVSRSGPTDTLLARLQRDIGADRPARPPTERPSLEPEDTSVQIHVSHGADRQVEVLREVLLGLLDDDPTLEPRDIVVLCPDIETFAPLIAATFGLDAGSSTEVAASGQQHSGPHHSGPHHSGPQHSGQQHSDPQHSGQQQPDQRRPSQPHPGHRLRVRLADRSLRRVNPLLSVLDRLLELADSRLPASALLDLAAAPPVARRFAFSEDDLERMAELVTASGVRWGLDRTHRARYGLGDFGQNTWAAGLDRMLLGVAMDSEGEYFIGTALPQDEVDSGDVDLVGRIAELVARVSAFGREVGGIGGDPAGAGNHPRSPSATRHPLAWWMATCREALESLTAVPSTETWQSTHAYGELARLAEASGGGDPGSELSLADVRDLLADAFKGRATRANFRTGTLTMCTMLPMRSVPHRVVCLLGVDDATFPRHRIADGDDILAEDPWIGDRDPRSEDRQLLLDAVLAAQERLVVVYSGIDARTGATKPVAVPIGELLDALDETATAPDGRPARALITTRHTLQPFDRANFQRPPDAARTGDRRPANFDRAALRGALAAAGPRREPPDVFAADGLPPAQPVTDLNLADLVRFFTNPARTLIRARAQLYLATDEPEPAEQMPIAPAGLDSWKIGDRLLQRHLQGIDIEQLVAAEWRRGELPPKALGAETMGSVRTEVARLRTDAEPFLTGEAQTHDVSVELAGRTITGTVAAVHGERILTVRYAKLAPKQRLQAWIELLCLTATDPDIPWHAVTIGRGGRSVLGPVTERFARLVLADLIELCDTGRNEPLPFAPSTSHEYARIRRDGKSVDSLKGLIERAWRRERERDEDLARFWPESLTELLAARSGPADVRGDLGEPSRFGSLARRVWQPLLDCEELR